MTTGIISDALENAWLNHVLRNTAYTSPGTAVYAALFTSNPADDFSGTECTGDGYARVQLQGTAEWNAPGTTRVTANTNAVTFPTATGAGTRQLGAAGQLDITSEMTATGSTGSSLSANLVLTSVMTALGWILAKGAGARVPYNVANRPTNGTTTRTSATTNNRDAYEVSHRVTHEADTRGEVEIEY
jgi:hypothetical protein